MQQPTLFELPTNELMARFGAGNATPGSGCAAALMSLLGAKLVSAVAKLTIEKGSVDAQAQARVILQPLETRISPRLQILFEEDARLFDLVIEARKLRDAAATQTDKRRFTQLASERLKEATDILQEIVDLSFQILDAGRAIWQVGFRPAMGDAGAGISAAIAAITTCQLVANLNLRTARSTWGRAARVSWGEVSERLLGAQRQLMDLVQSSNEHTEHHLLNQPEILTTNRR